jgi:capsular polysaccharide transport system permease protein
MDGFSFLPLSTSPVQRAFLAGQRPSAPNRRRFRGLRKLLPFLIIVMLPTAIVATYYLGFAADQYVSEVRFVVRGPNAASPGMLSSLLGGGAGRADEDTYAVQDYMTSRDALTELVRGSNLKAVYDAPEADALSRFPLLKRWDTTEHLYAYYLRHIDAELDSITGVSSLKVRAFKAIDAQRIASALIVAAERLVNQMNDRQRENALRDSRADIRVAERRIEDIANNIADFRNRESLLDPGKQSGPMLQAIMDLETQLGRVRLQIAQISAAAPRSPLLPDYRERATLLEQQIATARSRITGDDQSLVPKIKEFDALILQKEFADKQLASAITSLESARLQVERQQAYLDLIVQPNISDYPAYPKQIAAIAVFFASVLGMYVMGALLIAGAREHRLT